MGGTDESRLRGRREGRFGGVRLVGIFVPWQAVALTLTLVVGLTALAAVRWSGDSGARVRLAAAAETTTTTIVDGATTSSTAQASSTTTAPTTTTTAGAAKLTVAAPLPTTTTTPTSATTTAVAPVITTTTDTRPPVWSRRCQTYEREQAAITDATWTLDGKQVILTSDVWTIGSEVYVDVEYVAADENGDGQPDWQPDGTPDEYLWFESPYAEICPGERVVFLFGGKHQIANAILIGPADRGRPNMRDGHMEHMR